MAPKFVAMSRSHKLITLALNTQDSIEQARGRSHEEVSSRIFMLYVMWLGGFGLWVSNYDSN